MARVCGADTALIPPAYTAGTAPAEGGPAVCAPFTATSPLDGRGVDWAGTGLHPSWAAVLAVGLQLLSVAVAGDGGKGAGGTQMYELRGPCVEGVGAFAPLHAPAATHGAPMWTAGDAAGVWRGLVAAIVSGTHAGMEAAAHLSAARAGALDALLQRLAAGSAAPAPAPDATTDAGVVAPPPPPGSAPPRPAPPPPTDRVDLPHLVGRRMPALHEVRAYSLTAGWTGACSVIFVGRACVCVCV